MTHAYGGDPTGLAGKHHYGGGGLGVLASLIPSTGTHGPGYIYNSLALPADAAKEYYGLLGTLPAGLTITPSEDSSFTASGADGFYVVPFDMYENGAYMGPSSFTVVFGAFATLAGANSTQSATSSAGAVTVTPAGGNATIDLVGANASQSATCTTGAVTVTAQRYARPMSDVSAGPWTPSTGTSLAAMIDEPEVDSADYITTTSGGTCEIALNPVVDPMASAGQVVRYQVWSTTGSALTVSLKQGSTVIASWNHSSLPMTPTIFTQTLTSLQCDSITNYADLRFEFTAG